jgi:transketolase
VSYEETLAALALADPRLVVMTAENRAAIRSLPARLGPRFVDVGICEQTMIGMAAGLALRGRIPVVHALASFLTMRAFEFIRTDVGLGGLPVKLVGAVPGFLSEANGPTHQAVEDLALMRGIPGMEVVCPSDEDELAAALPAVLASPRPCYLRANALPAQVAHRTPFVLGRAETLLEGTDVTLCSHGFLLREVARAASLLVAEGLSVRLIDLRSLAPLDEEVLLRAARETRLVVTVEDHFASGGLYTQLAELLVRQRLSVATLPIALPGRWFRPALLPDVLEVEGFTGPQLAAQVLAAWAKERLSHV